MGGLTFLAFLALGTLLLGAFALLTAIAQALGAYSRSLLEERCEQMGRPQRVQDVALEGTRTQRGAEALALLVGLALVLSLTWAIAIHMPPSWQRPVALAAVATAGLVHLLAVAFGRVYAETLLDRLWPVARGIRLLAWPWLAAERLAESRILSGDPDAISTPRPASVEVEISHSPEESEGKLEAELPEITRERMENLVRLNQTTIEQVMTPRSSLVTLPESASIIEAARVFVESGRSRIPLFGESRDHIVGILYFKDMIPELLEGKRPESVRARELARPPFLVPETKNAAHLLDELRRKRVQIAIALDEYGVVTGVVTIEDLIEVIIGPIDDEHDVPTPDDTLVLLQDGTYEVDGAMTLEELNERLGLRLPTEEDFQTIGGLAFNALGHLPGPGESFRSHGIDFTVLEVVEHSIRRLKLDLTGRTTAQAPAG